MLQQNLKKTKKPKIMNRRDALKNLTLGLGYTVATPTILSILNSCTSKTEPWIPLFLSETEKYVVSQLSDIILPASETLGALNVNTTQFLDLMYHDIEIEENKKLFKSGANLFSEKFTSLFKYEVHKGKKEDLEKLLNVFFNVSDENVELIFEQQKKHLNQIPLEDVEAYSIYKFLTQVRYYTLFGYYTSEEVGENILAYDPIPGIYNACIPVEEATGGKAWSL